MVLKRSLTGDLKSALGVLAGMALAILVFDQDFALLIAPVIVAVLLVAVRAAIRRNPRGATAPPPAS